MTQGWILDVGAVYDDEDRQEVVHLLPRVRAIGKRMVLPTHVLMELARQEVQVEREFAAYARLDPALVTASSVIAKLRGALNGVEFIDFTLQDAPALLDWLHRPGIGTRAWEERKLRKAVEEAWPPYRAALGARSCPTCTRPASDCECAQPLWSQRQDKGQLRQAAAMHAERLARANQARASSTIDWLTAAMARRQDLTIVTRDKGAIEWEGLPWIPVDQLGVQIGTGP